MLWALKLGSLYFIAWLHNVQSGQGAFKQSRGRFNIITIVLVCTTSRLYICFPLKWILCSLSHTVTAASCYISVLCSCGNRISVPCLFTANPVCFLPYEARYRNTVTAAAQHTNITWSCGNRIAKGLKMYSQAEDYDVSFRITFCYVLRSTSILIQYLWL